LIIRDDKKESFTGVEVKSPNSVKDVGTSINKAGKYFRYLPPLSGGPLSISKLAVEVGTSTSGASRDMKDFANTAPPVIHRFDEPNPNGSHSKMVTLTPLGRKIWKLGAEEIRLSSEQRKLSRVDPKLLNFLLYRARSSYPKMKDAALEALLIEANKQRVWEAPLLWKFLKELFSKNENLDFATELLHRMVFRACQDDDRNSKSSVKEAMKGLWKTKIEETEFWRAIVDKNSPLNLFKDNLLGVLQYISAPAEFFQAVWDLWTWRARVRKPEDDIDDRRFCEEVEPLIVEIQATPEKIRRARLTEAFALMEEGEAKGAQLFLAERGRRITTHVLR
jgi:hypothetical protein